MQKQLYTIGHSNHTFDVFFDLLGSHSISILFDVRSGPYSRYVPDFNRDNLRRALEKTGVEYRFIGDKLGGRPLESEFYDQDGHVLYKRVAESPRFLEGIVAVEHVLQNQRVAIMCSEEDPLQCHRHLLVGRVMAERGITMVHVRKDGSLQTDEDLSPVQEEQGLLFEDFEELEWRSIRSVLPKNQPNNSSES